MQSSVECCPEEGLGYKRGAMLHCQSVWGTGRHVAGCLPSCRKKANLKYFFFLLVCCSSFVFRLLLSIFTSCVCKILSPLCGEEFGENLKRKTEAQSAELSVLFGWEKKNPKTIRSRKAL